MSILEQLTHSRRKEDLDLYVAVLSSVIEGRSAIYVSGPINTGLRFNSWYLEAGRFLDSKSGDYLRAHRKNVVNPNIGKIKTIAHRMRRAEHLQVIEPTSFEVPYWVQDDYRYFWGQVIARYVCKVTFLAGWEYSKGCSYEFAVAAMAGIPTFSECRDSLALRSGREMIQAAVRNMKAIGIKPDFNGEVLRVLDQLLVQSEPGSGRIRGQ